MMQRQLLAIQEAQSVASGPFFGSAESPELAVLQTNMLQAELAFVKPRLLLSKTVSRRWLATDSIPARRAEHCFFFLFQTLTNDFLCASNQSFLLIHD